MLFSTNYFGNIPYFQELAKYSSVSIDVHERYKKQSWRNRTKILESNGPLYLSIPVFRPHGNKSCVNEIEILYTSNWQKEHWKAIESSYQHAPYFFYYGEQIKELIYTSEKELVQFNTAILRKMIEWLDLKINISFSATYLSPIDETDNRIALDKKKYNFPQEKYIQVFSDKYDFFENLSILDLIMNLGPLAHNYILKK